MEKQKTTVFGGVLNALNANRRKKSTINPTSPGMGVTQTMPTLDMQGGVEMAQQQYLDWQVNKIAHDLYTRTIYYDTDRISAYQDFRAMDGSPEIAAALNIIRDECLEANSIIPLLNGEKITIEDLYNSNCINFYVYSYNTEKKIFEPGLCERVTYKGEQDVYRITFDDDSYVDATSEHLWLIKGTNEYAKTKDLIENQSIEPFYTKISNIHDRIKGYEMVLENGLWEYTHRIVKRKIFAEEKGVVHHKDFNKLNNDPSNLQVLTWKEHQKLHQDLASERWKKNEGYSKKMRKIFSEINSKDGRYWSDPKWREERVEKIRKRQKEKYSKYSKEELKEIFGYPGSKNPMYKNGEKISGEKNGRYLKDKRREFSYEEIINAYENSSNIEEACSILNTNRRILYKSKIYKSLDIKRWEDIGFLKDNINIKKLHSCCEEYLGKITLENNFGFICKKNGWKTRKVLTFLQKNGYKTWGDFVHKYDSKNAILGLIKLEIIKNGEKNLSVICRKNNLNRKSIDVILNKSKYKNFTNFIQSINHKIKKVEFLGKRKTYDLVNVKTQNNFVVLTSNGTGIVSHNCLTRNDSGNILEVYSENKRVKEVLNDLFKNVLNVEFNLRLWIRDLVKYGDYFVLLQIDREVGIYDFLTLPMEELHREEGFDGRTGSIRFRWETTGDYFEEWQVAHFRLLEDSKKLPYGRSILDSSRKLWKQLQLAEDAMLVYRITRAPDRRIFYIEVGNLPDGDIKTYMSAIQNQVRKQSLVDSRTGNVSQKYDPENVTEDYWIPIRGDKSSKVEVLPGACLSLNTKIELLDGRSLELSEIIKEFDKGNNLWSYSINPETGEIVPGKITWAGVTRKDTQVVKIVLDNGESIICTPDHKFPTRFGGEKEAKDLKEGESLWSFNKDFKHINSLDSNCEMVYDHSKDKWEFTDVILKEYFKNECFCETIGDGFVDTYNVLKRESVVVQDTLTQSLVLSIEWLDTKQDTGTITIDGNEEFHNYHNFALSCGVFTKNSNMDQIQDIEYLQNKLFAALQVPKPYLNYAGSMPGGSTLSQADIRFSRTINSIQEAILLELRRVANVHLYFMGFTDDLDNFQLTLTNPSTQQELLKLEVMKARLEVFKEFFNTESGAPSSYTWAMENILGFSKSDIKLMLRQKKVEKKIFAEIESSVETYKKIGLFDELDERYEDPNAIVTTTTGGEDGEGGGDFGGGGGGGLSGLGGFGGDVDMGGDDEGIDDLEGTETPEEESISESKYSMFVKKSDKRINMYLNELLGPDDIVLKKNIEAKKTEENALVKNNQKASVRTKRLLESIGSTLDSVDLSKIKTINEDSDKSDKYADATNALIISNDENNKKTQELFDTLDRIS